LKFKDVRNILIEFAAGPASEASLLAYERARTNVADATRKKQAASDRARRRVLAEAHPPGAAAVQAALGGGSGSGERGPQGPPGAGPVSVRSVDVLYYSHLHGAWREVRRALFI